MRNTFLQAFLITCNSLFKSIPIFVNLYFLNMSVRDQYRLITGKFPASYVTTSYTLLNHNAIHHFKRIAVMLIYQCRKKSIARRKVRSITEITTFTDPHDTKCVSYKRLKILFFTKIKFTLAKIQKALVIAKLAVCPFIF